MSDKTIVIDTPEGIAFFQLLSIRGRCRLHAKGLRFKNGSPFTAAKRIYNLKGSNAVVLAALDQMVEDAIAHRA